MPRVETTIRSAALFPSRGLAVLALTVVWATACSPPAVARRCYEDRECPAGYGCDLELRQCRARSNEAHSTSDAALLDGATAVDGGAGTDHQETDASGSPSDRRPIDRVANPDASAGADHRVRVDAASPERDAGDADIAHTASDAQAGVDRAPPPPRAQALLIDVDEDSTALIELRANTSLPDPVVFAIDTGTSHGQIDLAQATVTYVPAPDYFGDDAFRYYARQGNLVGPSVEVSIHVQSVNDAPVAQGQRVQTPLNTEIAISLSAADVESDSFTFSLLQPPAHGQVHIAGSSATYVPDLNFYGTDSFTHRARDADPGPPARIDVQVSAHFYGNGADGDLRVSGAVDLSTDNIISGRSCTDGGDAVAYAVNGLDADSAVLSMAPANGCLSPGDEVLLIHLRGAVGLASNQGRHEFLRVSSVSGDRVYFDRNKTHFYGTTAGGDTDIGGANGQQRVMLQRVPNYASLQVATGSTLTTAPFDGRRGGVIALRVAGQADIQGSVDVSGLGFRGGVAGGAQPEGSSGRSSLGGGGGGGGSGGHNGSSSCGTGGLGADGAQGGYCGLGGSSYNACPSVPGMCSTFSCGGDASGGGGGGGAGYGYEHGSGGQSPGGGGRGGDKVNNAGRAGGNATGAGGGGGGGAAGRDSGGGGGGGSPYRSLDNSAVSDTERVSLGGGAAAGAGGGGGGGAGDYNCAEGGGGGGANGLGGAAGSDNCSAADSSSGQDGAKGGAGGGILLLNARNLVVMGTLNAGGSPGGAGGDGGSGAAIGSCATRRAGAGGGGGGGAWGAAGGSIELRAETLDLGADRVRSLGGVGGSGGVGAGSNAGAGGKHSGRGGDGAPGSTGSDGFVRLYYSGSVSGSTLPPAQETLFTP